MSEEKKWTQKQKPTGRKALTNIQKLERIVDMEVDALYKKASDHQKGKGLGLTADDVSRLEKLIKSQAGMDERKKALAEFEEQAEEVFDDMTPEQIRAAVNDLKGKAQQ